MFFKNTNKINLKQIAAKEAVEFIKQDMIVGIGTGSTVDYFIDAIIPIKNKISKVVASSKKTKEKLEKAGFDVEELNQVNQVDIYIDGADEANKNLELIKGGGAALTREKICAAAAEFFICIIDESKLVKNLGKFPLPVEVIPMASSYVAKELIKLGGQPVYREGTITDNGNIILDLYNMDIENPAKLESTINQIAGVVCNGIFAHKKPNKLIIAKSDGTVEIID